MVVVATALGPYRELQQTVSVVLWKENSGGFLFVFDFVWGGIVCVFVRQNLAVLPRLVLNSWDQLWSSFQPPNELE